MAIYQDLFLIGDVALVHEKYLRTIEAGREADRLRVRAGLPPVNQARVDRLRLAYTEFQRGLRDVARLASLNATIKIEEQIRKTAVRADTGVSPHLRDRIVCRALPPIGSFETGAVGVADEEILNASGKGLYWKAQEYGTGTEEVRSITTAATGRLLKGYFYSTGFRGFPSPPNPGDGLARTHSVFQAGPPRGGQDVPFGIGVVRREIQGRHFIRDGAAVAAAQWRAQLDALQTQQVSVVTGLL